MESKAASQSKPCMLSPPMKKDMELRRTCSEVVGRVADLIADTSEPPRHTPRPGPEAEEKVPCACCGVSELCTASYIHTVRAAFCGAWVCGLCGEAVKERLQRGGPGAAMADALGAHTAMCRDFDETRLNPKLSLAGSMRDIARKSLRRRTSFQDGLCASKAAAAMARTVSCGPRFLM